MPSTTDYNILTIVSRENNAPATPYMARTYAADPGLGSPAKEGRLAAVPGGVLAWAFGDHVPLGARLEFEMPFVDGSTTERLKSPIPISLDPDGNPNQQKQKAVIYVLTVPPSVQSCDDVYKAWVTVNGKKHLVQGPWDEAPGAQDAVAPATTMKAKAPGDTGEIKVPPSGGGGTPFIPPKGKALGVGVLVFLLGAVIGLVLAGGLG